MSEVEHEFRVERFNSVLREVRDFTSENLLPILNEINENELQYGGNIGHSFLEPGSINGRDVNVVYTVHLSWDRRKYSESFTDEISVCCHEDGRVFVVGAGGIVPMRVIDTSKDEWWEEYEAAVREIYETPGASAATDESIGVRLLPRLYRDRRR